MNHLDALGPPPSYITKAVVDDFLFEFDTDEDRKRASNDNIDELSSKRSCLVSTPVSTPTNDSKSIIASLQQQMAALALSQQETSKVNAQLLQRLILLEANNKGKEGKTNHMTTCHLSLSLWASNIFSTFLLVNNNPTLPEPKEKAETPSEVSDDKSVSGDNSFVSAVALLDSDEADGSFNKSLACQDIGPEKVDGLSNDSLLGQDIVMTSPQENTGIDIVEHDDANVGTNEHKCTDHQDLAVDKKDTGTCIVCYIVYFAIVTKLTMWFLNLFSAYDWSDDSKKYCKMFEDLGDPVFPQAGRSVIGYTDDGDKTLQENRHIFVKKGKTRIDGKDFLVYWCRHNFENVTAYYKFCAHHLVYPTELAYMSKHPYAPIFVDRPDNSKGKPGKTFRQDCVLVPYFEDKNKDSNWLDLPDKLDTIFEE